MTPVNQCQPIRHWMHGLLVAVALSLAACDETVQASYPTAAAARADGAIQRGWLPQELPDSAFDITESHDLDTNTGNGAFHFQAASADSFRGKLQPATPADAQHFPDPERLRTDAYQFYVVPEFILAVNWQKRHVRFVLNTKSQ